MQEKYVHSELRFPIQMTRGAPDTTWRQQALPVPPICPRALHRRSDADSECPQGAIFNLFYANQGGFEPSINNIYLAGIKVVEGILNGWNSTFAKGIPATNYIGDIFGSLGGVPDFGPGPSSNDNPVKKRSLKGRNAAKGYA